MVGKNQVRAIAQEQPPANFDAGFFQIFELAKQSHRIDHRAGADYGLLFRPQDAAGNELQDVAMIIEDDRVPGIVPAGIARGVIERRGHVVDDLALPFVAPLRAYDRNCFSAGLLRHSQRPLTTLLARARSG